MITRAARAHVAVTMCAGNPILGGGLWTHLGTRGETETILTRKPPNDNGNQRGRTFVNYVLRFSADHDLQMCIHGAREAMQIYLFGKYALLDTCDGFHRSGGQPSGYFT